MSFEQLLWATRIYHKSNPYFSIVSEWEEKREHLLVYILDLPHLVEEYKSSENHLYQNDSRINISNKIPRIRLASTCEAATNCLYSMAEISSQFSNKASKGYLPASFNDFRKKLENGKYSTKLLERLGDLQWYRKIREIRTEWVHYSTIFIGGRDEPIMVVKGFRRFSDKQEFSSKIQVSMPELIDWIKSAIHTIDAFGDYLLEEYILPSFQMHEQIIMPKFDLNGLPIFLSNGSLDVEQVSVREYLQKGSISVL